jgi:outer membrane protein OmpA-like peptidoglycan-associated protein
MLFWLVASLAGAADEAPRMNTQLFRPALDSKATLWSEDTSARPDGYGSARAFFQYANAPFRYRTDDGVTRVVSDLLELDVLGTFTFKRLRLGMHAPVYLYTASQVAPETAGLGDLALDLRGTILEGDNAPVGLALSGRMMLPTASVDAALGATGIGWELMGAVDRRQGPVLLIGNVGTRGVPDAGYEEVAWNDQFFGRLGAGWYLTEKGGLSLDLAAQTNWASRYNPAGTAAEAMAGGFVPVSRDLMLRGGLAAGLSRSPGAPIFRGVMGMSFEPDPYPDHDLDGIVDRDDSCPMHPEDVDEYLDHDGCPDPTTYVRMRFLDEAGEDVTGVVASLQGSSTHQLSGDLLSVEVHPGTYQLEVEADGFEGLITQLEVPKAPGHSVVETLAAKVGSVRLWAVSPSGESLDAEVRISGADPVLVNGEPLELVVGEHALVFTSSGYGVDTVSMNVGRGETREYTAVLHPDAPVARVDVGSDQLHLSEKIFFDLNAATIQPDSYGLLDELATVLLAHPEIGRVQIEGHTDNRGPSRLNRTLSQKRAAAVRAYLVRKGVPELRLRSVGYGEERPLNRGETETAWEQNRRVEFRIQG